MAEWINVKDRLPKQDGKYLCLTDRDSVAELEFCDNNGKAGFYSMNSYGFYHKENVSYWMNLPKLPKRKIVKQKIGNNNTDDKSDNPQEKLSASEFYEKFCLECGSQRCEGIGTEWFEGCHYRELLKKDDNNG